MYANEVNVALRALYRGALCIPAFEIVTPEAEEKGEQDGDDGDDTGYAPEYNFEEVDYTVKPDFVDTVRGS